MDGQSFLQNYSGGKVVLRTKDGHENTQGVLVNVDEEAELFSMECGRGKEKHVVVTSFKDVEYMTVCPHKNCFRVHPLHKIDYELNAANCLGHGKGYRAIDYKDCPRCEKAPVKVNVLPIAQRQHPIVPMRGQSPSQNESPPNASNVIPSYTGVIILMTSLKQCLLVNDGPKEMYFPYCASREGIVEKMNSVTGLDVGGHIKKERYVDFLMDGIAFFRFFIVDLLDVRPPKLLGMSKVATIIP